MNKVVLVHYGELALKGKNRILFEKRLQDNIKIALKGYAVVVKRRYGRIVIESDDKLFFENQEEVSERLSKVFGIANFSFATQLKGGYEEIESVALELLQDIDIETFAVRAHRAAKNFELNSQQINEQLGATILGKFGGKVKLKNPDLEVHVLITSEANFIFTTKYSGAGGLPSGISGAVVSLLSSGIDSPVASYLLQKRGAKVIYCHFHSYPVTSRESIDNVKDIVAWLQQHQPASQLLLVPLSDLQKEVVKNAPKRLRIVMFRRAMYQIAEKLANSVSAKALVTGESLGQVASQTLDNLAATTAGIGLPIFRPLIGSDKQEIIEKAQQIRTYDISIRPYEDCCSLLLPDQVETQAQLHEVEKVENDLPWNNLIEQTIKNIERISV